MPEQNEHGQPVGDVVTDGAARAWPTPVRLEGNHVVLEPLALDHAPALHRALCDEESRPVRTYRPTEPPADALGLRRAGLPQVRVEVRLPRRAVAPGRDPARVHLRGPVPPPQGDHGQPFETVAGRPLQGPPDTDWFSVTDAQWPAVRAEHERWLDPDNVDPDERTPLRVVT